MYIYRLMYIHIYIPIYTSYYHLPITKHSAKQKIRNSILMQTWERTSTLTFRPIHITHPSYLYRLHFNKSPHKCPHMHSKYPHKCPQCTVSTTFLYQSTHLMLCKYHLPPLNPYIHLHALPQPVDIILAMFSWVLVIGLHTVYLTYPPRTHHHILQ